MQGGRLNGQENMGNRQEAEEIQEETKGVQGNGGRQGGNVG